MTVELILAPEVELDLTEAYVWYERRRLGLGEDFMTSVDACLQRICRNPESYETVHQGYRRALVRRFPFGVFYEHTESSVTVHAIFHTSRKPDDWHERLP